MIAASRLLTAPQTRSRVSTYREEIRWLDSQATPAPWAADGELYGVLHHGCLAPLGFAPHRPLDSRLIVVYRSALMQLIDAVDAVERLARASRAASLQAAIGIHQVLKILDAAGGDRTPFRRTLAELDHSTTPPPWDPGHVVLGMEVAAEVRSRGIATPKASDAPLIAVARTAVPRALELLALAEETIPQHGLPDGCQVGDWALAFVAGVAAFDQHCASEGSATGTV